MPSTDGKYFIAWKLHRNETTNLGDVVVDRCVLPDMQSAKRWCFAQCTLDTDPWESAYADERTEARNALKALHELEKQQDRYRIHN